MSIILNALYIALFLIVSVGCDEQQSNTIGDNNSVTADGDVENAEKDAADDAVCLYRTKTLSSLDEESQSMPFKGNDLLTLFEGEQLFRATYATENEIVAQSPLGGDTILVLTVAYDDGEIRDVVGKSDDCGNYLELDVAIAARTSDTAFAEEISGVLYFYKNVVSNEFQARLYADLNTEDLSGGFQIESLSESNSIQDVSLFLEQQVDVDGSLVGGVVIMDNQSSGENTIYQQALSWKSMLAKMK